MPPLSSPPLPHRPIVGLACLLIAGTGAGLKAGGDGILPLALAAAAAACSLAVYGTGRSGFRGLAAVATAVFCVGFLSGAASERTRRNEREWLASRVGQPVLLRGVVDRPTGARKITSRRASPPILTLRRVEIEHADGVQRLTQTPALVAWYGGGRLPETGETWSFRTRLPPLRARARPPGLWLNSRPADAAPLAPPRFWDWRPLADRARASASRRLALGIESWPVAPVLIQAMLLGTRSAIPREMNAVFRNSGTIHVFAISGLGIGIVAAVIATALALLGVPRPRWGLSLIPLLTGYTLLTGASPSAMRACLMAAFYFGAPLLGRKPDLWAALAAAAIAQLAWEPRDLFNLSFLLSYTVMAGLVLLCPPLSRLFRHALGVESAATKEALLRLSRRLALRGQPFAGNVWAVRAAMWRHTARVHLADTLAMGIAAWVASVPLTAFYFERFIPGGILANLVVVPASFLIVIAGALAVAASFFLPVAADIFNHAAAACTAVMIEASRLTVLLPGASIRVPAPPVPLIAAWYAAMLVAAWRLRAFRPADPPPFAGADGKRGP